MPCTFVWGNVMCFCFVLTFSASDGVERTQIDSKSDALVAVASLNFKVPIDLSSGGW